MGAVIRHYAAVKNGMVVGSCSTIRQYRYAVLHTTKAGTFATFHITLEGATRATLHMASSAPDKELVQPIETNVRMALGDLLPRPELEQVAHVRHLRLVIH